MSVVGKIVCRRGYGQWLIAYNQRVDPYTSGNATTWVAGRMEACSTWGDALNRINELVGAQVKP